MSCWVAAATSASRSENSVLRAVQAAELPELSRGTVAPDTTAPSESTIITTSSIACALQARGGQSLIVLWDAGGTEVGRTLLIASNRQVGAHAGLSVCIVLNMGSRSKWQQRGCWASFLQQASTASSSCQQCCCQPYEHSNSPS